VNKLLEKIKLALRRTGATFDTEIQNCIDYVKRDLLDLGVPFYDDANPRIINLTTLYAKSVFNFDNKGDWYLKEYERLRNQISMQGDYIE